jgi:ABC-2 type transport system ATP-binding protein
MNKLTDVNSLSALNVDQITKSFKADFYAKPVQVLKKMSFDVKLGRFVGFIGPNGAGKTTTIKCLLEYIFVDSGVIQFFHDSSILESKKRIGFLPERPYFQEFLSGVEFLKLHWSLSGIRNENFEDRAAEVLEQVKLTHAKNKKLRDYSKGMLQRIGIAQALLARPDFLILDEPMSGLDPDGRILIKDILKSLKEQNMTLFMSSHLLEDVDELCDDLIIVHKGETLYCGTLSKFKENFTNLEQAYRAFKGQLVMDYNV